MIEYFLFIFLRRTINAYRLYAPSVLEQVLESHDLEYQISENRVSEKSCFRIKHSEKSCFRIKLLEEACFRKSYRT